MIRRFICITAALLAGVATAAAQYDGDFSHRKHLGYGAGCVDCHTGATTSTKASDSLLPGIEVCSKCHGPGEVKQPRKLMVTKFNHKLHTSFPGLGGVIGAAVASGGYLGPAPERLAKQLAGADRCTACHRGLDTSDKVTKAAFPAMADCLVCHGEIEPPFSCEKCHDAGAALMPASHVADFLEAHSRPGMLSEKESCAVCHGKRFTCMGCH